MKKLKIQHNNKNRRKVLFIDDDIVVLQMGKLMLKDLGYDTILADGGKKGVELLNTNKKIDLILLDLMMPDMYGLDVLRYIKSQKTLREIPLILQTGVRNQEDIDAAYKLGIFGVLAKPYNKKDLLSVMDSLQIFDFQSNHAL